MGCQPGGAPVEVQASVAGEPGHIPSPAGDRVRPARERVTPTLRRLASGAGLRAPIRRLYFRAFKAERELEVWGSDGTGAFRLVKRYAVYGASGVAGPKRREGDRQVPEGFYVIDRFNPRSAFHLSLGLDYPNASDRVRSDARRPGGDIFIHGHVASIGCLAMTDVKMEEIYVLADDARLAGQRGIRVDIFPARPGSQEWERLRRERPELRAFWDELRPGFDLFERDRQPTRVRVAADGRYVLSSGR